MKPARMRAVLRVEVRSYPQCIYCGGQREGLLSLDHFFPSNAVGRTRIASSLGPVNWIPACSACNQTKANADPRVWLKTRDLAVILLRLEQYCAALTEQRIAPPTPVLLCVRELAHGKAPTPAIIYTDGLALRVSLADALVAALPTRDPMTITASTGWGFHRRQNCMCRDCWRQTLARAQ